MTFDKVQNFKYLEVAVKAYSHEEINHRMIAGNKCYFSLVPPFKSNLWKAENKYCIRSQFRSQIEQDQQTDPEGKL